MDEIVGCQEINAVVVPFVRLGDAHIGGNHEESAVVVATGDKGIAGTSLDGGDVVGVEHGHPIEDVLIVQTVPAHGIGRPFTSVAHVAVEPMVTNLQVLSLCCDGRQ